MSDYQERRQRIRKNLKIQSITHGQVHTCQIGMAEPPQISDDRREELGWSLQNHQSNLIPIVVRRTDRFGDDIEYEVIYGAEWVVVAEALGIEMLWAWVFDLNDDEVAATREEWAILLDTPINDRPFPDRSAAPAQHSVSFNVSREELVQLFDERLDHHLTRHLTRQGTMSPTEPVPESMNHSDHHSELVNQVQVLTQKVEALSDRVSRPAEPASGSIESMQKVLESLERSVSEICKLILPGSTITITIKPPVSDREAQKKPTNPYEKMKVEQLKAIAKQNNIKGVSKLNRPALIKRLMEAQIDLMDAQID
jgi:hypothetical protein